MGLSLDVCRQGQAWTSLQKQNASQCITYRYGSADGKDYPTNADLKDMAWSLRISNALERALQGFSERWLIPAITVVRGYNPQAERLYSPEKTEK